MLPLTVDDLLAFHLQRQFSVYLSRRHPHFLHVYFPVCRLRQDLFADSSCGVKLRRDHIQYKPTDNSRLYGKQKFENCALSTCQGYLLCKVMLLFLSCSVYARTRLTYRRCRTPVRLSVTSRCPVKTKCSYSMARFHHRIAQGL